MTKYSSTYNKLSLRQTFMIVVAVLCLVLSSCAVKANVKYFLDLQTTEQSQNPIKQNGKQYISSTSQICHYDQLSEITIVQKAGFEFSQNTLATLVCCAFLYFLLGLHSVNKENKHPLYYGSRKIPKTIPLFLEYRKLIIYHSS